jgi:biopolymer transport protein ExbD
MAAGGATDADDAITGINVTPLVDITLVLLIIFMVTAKLLVSQAVPLVLPDAVSGGPVQEAFSIVLAEDGSTRVDSTPIANEDEIVPLARTALGRSADLRAIIKADGAVPHRRVIRVLDLLKRAGVSKIAFGVNPVEEPVPHPRSAPVGPAHAPP